MSKLSKSPARNTFQRNAYIERCLNDNEQPDPTMIRMYESILSSHDPVEATGEDNLEYVLRSTDWILQKVRENDFYAQHLYAAMCNNDWRRADVMPILKGESWGCSWRHAGGIIADMQQKGDYIDWYCSGMHDGDNGDVNTHTVSEGTITDEVREDLRKLGWIEAEEKNVR